MEPAVMSFEQIEELFRVVSCTILGIDLEDINTVRFPHGSSPDVGNAPGFTREKNVCFIFVIPNDDGYGQQHHVSYHPQEENDLLTRVDEHTDIYDVNFVCYGPCGHEWANKIKNGLYRDDIRRLLKSSSFFLRAGIPPIVPVHELREGTWWRRYDVKPTFYSAVRIVQRDFIPAYEKVNITYPH
jgi:hypothetical protein